MTRHNLNRVTGIVLVIFFSLLSAFGQTRKDSLIVFVGEKIEVEYLYVPVETSTIEGNDTILFIKSDCEYLAKYKILQLVHGSYKSDTIEFTAFDPYGKPAFSKYQTVLLFVSEYDNGLYEEVQLFFDLYMTKKGKWASPYSSEDYNHPYKDSITVKPEKVPFTDKVFYSVEEMDTISINERFPQPFYKIKKKRAIPIYGNYVEDLFKLQQQTVLKARGIY